MVGVGPLGASSLVDPARLGSYLSTHLNGVAADLEATRVTTGTSNEIFEIRTSAGTWILRRPPRVRTSPTAHDMAREFRVLRALEGTPVPHPRPLLYCDNESVIGAPFYLMERINGFNLKMPFRSPFATERQACHDAAMAFIDVLADLGRIDWRAAGLEGFGRPDGYLERQVDRWRGQLARYQFRDIPHLDWVADWLRARTPVMGEPGIIHGDYQFLNVLFAADEPTRVAAVVDWEQSTIADPLCDLGWVLGLWDEEGERGHVKPAGSAASAQPGMPTRRQLADRYAARSGRSISELRYYEALALFKLACVIEGAYRRYVDGNSDNAAHADFEWTVPRLLELARDIGEGRRD